jgi:hypothetical protein
MVRTSAAISLGVLLCAILPAYGDFKYTESSKVTGGAMNGMMKFAGAFSKQARQATGPMESTTYVKGNRMRKDQTDGHTQIFDLDARRIIYIDNQKRTYSIVTFDQMRAAMKRARAQAQTQNASQPQPQDQPRPNVQVTPKVDVTRTGKTATILNLPASEVQMNLDMEMQSTDPKSQGQSASMWMKSDSWVTPNIPGYEELTAFSRKMAHELDWVPGTLFGGNPQMSQGMAQLGQHADELKGFPVLQYISMGMAASGQTSQGGQAQQPQQPQPKPADSQSVSPLTSPSAALAKSFGGMFGHRKKQNQDQTAQDGSAGAQTSGQPAAPPSTQGSLMDMTVQVTSYSSDTLDADLFEPPSGYTQVQSDTEREMGRPNVQ